MLSLLLSLALSAASPNAATAEPAGGQQSQPAKPAKPKKVCERIESTGSSVPKKVCRTVKAPAAETGTVEAAADTKPAGNSTN